MSNLIDVNPIAKVCHEANRAYCQTIGDRSQPTWEEAPDWQRRSAIAGVRFHLEALASGQVPAASASHDEWLRGKRAEGWTYGPVKDPEKRVHPCFLPYEDLPLEQRMKDYIFGSIVAAFYGANKLEAQTTR